jgi:hypothetical protein
MPVYTHTHAFVVRPIDRSAAAFAGASHGKPGTQYKTMLCTSMLQAISEYGRFGSDTRKTRELNAPVCQGRKSCAKE